MATRIVDTDRKPARAYARDYFINTCVVFALAMVFFMAFSSILGGSSFAPGMAMGWGLLVASIVSSALQLIFFTPALIKHMGYSLRTLLFGICFFPVLAGIGVLFDWFPLDIPAAWASFTIIYLVLLVLLSLLFNRVYKRQIRELNERLAAFKREHRS